MKTRVDLREAARGLAFQLGDVWASPDLLESARLTWRGRMINERESASVFEGLSAQFERTSASPELVSEVRGFADEERRHGELCGAVLEALGGQAIYEADTPESFPQHEDVSLDEAVLRNVLSICCLAETVAVALIGAERLEMPEGPLRELLSGILADEIGHARFGWRYLDQVAATLDPKTRASLGDYLQIAFAHLEVHQHQNLQLGSSPAASGASLGLCDASAQRALFHDTVERVIVPRLEAAGLPARRAFALRHEAAAQA